MRSGRTGWTTYGCSHWTVLRAIGSQISSRSKSGHSTCRRMERVSLYCAATMILMLFCCKNPSCEAAVTKTSSPCGKTPTDPDIPILKEAKTEYAKLQ